MSDNLLILCVGIPQSGKSTWAREQRHPIVSPDAIRLGLHGQPYIQKAESFVWAIAHTMVAALFNAGHKTVIVDATNTTRKRRDEWKSSDWDRCFFYFGEYEEIETSHDEETIPRTAVRGASETFVKLCIDRAAETAIDENHRVALVSAINRMAEQFEPVSEDEGVDSYHAYNDKYHWNKVRAANEQTREDS